MKNEGRGNDDIICETELHSLQAMQIRGHTSEAKPIVIKRICWAQLTASGARIKVKSNASVLRHQGNQCFHADSLVITHLTCTVALDIIQICS
jgi:hypothetical protein